MEEKYTLRITVEKLLEGPNGFSAPCHSAIIESNGLSLKDTQDMQSELAPVILGFVSKDEPQEGPPPSK